MTAMLYMSTLCLPLGTVLLVFTIRYASKAYQAKARLANDDAYRLIADKAATAETETAASLAVIRDALSDLQTRLAAVETILKAVG